MKKLTKFGFSLIAILSISLLFVQCKDAKDAAVTKFMELQAEQINKQCPVDMGGVTLKSCEVEANKTFKYLYVIAGDVETFDVEAGKAATIQALKNTPEFKQIEEFGISCLYVYHNSQNKLLGEIKITPEDYK
ncbi:MAG: hypothetical protein ACK5KT_07940 [Dysgonomonas sp.]